MKILVLLNICCFPENNKSIDKTKKRTEQFVNGLKCFFKYNAYNKDIDFYITDNSIKEHYCLPEEILNIIPKHVNLSLFYKNEFGKINKGTGLIDSWLYNKELIKKYDYVIHFEPRQLLKSNQFIESFLENPRNLFTVGIKDQAFNTGLFCIKTSHLLYYIQMTNLFQMINEYISIEYDLYKYFIKFNIKYDTLEKMDLLWFESKTNIIEM